MNRHFILAVLICIAACGGRTKALTSTSHYDLSKPEKMVLPESLHEISGIAFSNQSDTIYAEQDEQGRIFHFNWKDKNIISSRFTGKGDFEDIAIFKSIVIMLRSDGTLFTVPLNELNDKDATGTIKLDNLLPGGEYEGIYAVEKTNNLYVLCKHCKTDKADQQTKGYIFTLSPNGKITPAGTFFLDHRRIEKITGEKKIKLHPSALAKNQFTNEWYILSSVNRLLVITNEKWEVKECVPLDRALFAQPEGIAFDGHNNLYISNEGDAASAGNILKFNYRN
jgi:hypothetical protein